MLEEFDQIRSSDRWKEVGVKVFGTLFIVIIALVLTFFYLIHQNQVKQEEANRQEQREKEALQLDQSNNEYIQMMKPICSKPVLEITALDFFKCRTIKEDSYINLIFELENPDLPSFCLRKIQELITNEFIECLEEKPPPEL